MVFFDSMLIFAVSWFNFIGVRVKMFVLEYFICLLLLIGCGFSAAFVDCCRSKLTNKHEGEAEAACVERFHVTASVQ